MKPRKTPPNRKHDCLTQCLSRLLDINYSEVPFYGKDSAASDWLAKLRIWANKKGYSMRLMDDTRHIWPTYKVIGVGKSPSGRPTDHAVIVDIVCDEPIVLWDPTYNNKKSIKEFKYFLVFRKMC